MLQLNVTYGLDNRRNSISPLEATCREVSYIFGNRYGNSYRCIWYTFQTARRSMALGST